MSLSLYMDQHVPRAITDGLRLRGINVLTAFEDAAAALPDPELLQRAGQLDRVLFTFDDDLLRIAATWQEQGQRFAGLVYAHPLRVSIGRCVADLALLAEAAAIEELRNQVLFLPI